MSSDDNSSFDVPVDPSPRLVQRLDLPGVASSPGFWPGSDGAFSEAVQAAHIWLAEHGVLRMDGLPLSWVRASMETLPESYVLEVSATGARIYAADLPGAIYGVSTLCQLVEHWIGDLPALRIDDRPDLPFRAAHIDLRTQKFKLEKLKKIISRLAFYRYNLVVMEYEDAFPLGVEIKAETSVQEAPRYSIEEIRDIYTYAAVFGVELVPLIQTMGHLEYVLRDPVYHSQCERGPTGELYLDELCPLHPESLPFALRLVDRVMAVHPGRYVHIGGDEVWHLGSCERCRQEKPEELYLRHILPVLEHVRHAGRTAFYWADFIKNHPQAVDRLPAGAVPIEWQYEPAEQQGNNASLENYTRLRKRGLPALTAPSVHCYLSGSYGLDVMGAMINVEQMCRTAWEAQGQGALVTNWNTGGSFQNVLLAGTNISMRGYPSRPALAPLHRRPHFDITWPLLIWGAQCLWNAHQPRREAFWGRIGFHLFGVDGPAFLDAYSALGTLAQEAEPHQLESSFKRALTGLDGLHPTRDMETWEQLRHAAEFGLLHARRLALVKRWSQERAELEAQFQGLEARFRAAYQSDMPESEVEAELWDRFHRSWLP